MYLLHPWSLAAFANPLDAGAVLIAVGLPALHGQTPWSARRWRFVSEGLCQRTPQLWWGDLHALAQALRGARSVHWQWEAHAQPALEALQMRLQEFENPPSLQPVSEAPLFTPVDRYCESFTQWWRLSRLAP